MADWNTGRPRQVAARYHNDGTGGTAAVSELRVRNSFFSLANGTLTVDANSTGRNVTVATIYVNTIELTVGATTVVYIFSNFDFTLDGVAGAVGDLQLNTVVGTGITDTIDTVPSINFGFGQHSTSNTIFPTIFSLAPDSATWQMYGVTSGSNQRGQIQRTQTY
jgi:hypothetical protein